MRVTDTLLARSLPYVPRPVVGAVASRYIAGETLDDAVATVRELNAGGMLGTIDALGEAISSRDEAAAVLEEYRRVLRAIRECGLGSGISIKLTALGLELDSGLCRKHVDALVGEAAAQGSFVRIDMEQSALTDVTLDLYQSLRDGGHDNVGVVLQAMLRRTPGDAERLAREGASVRLCKGIYREPTSVAHQDPEAIRRCYLAALRSLLGEGSTVAVATHDEALVLEAERLIEQHGAQDRCEFQMLLGVAEPLRARVLARGRRLRVYVPYGARWYEYSLRRLQENPRIAGHVARALAGRMLGRGEG